MLPHFWQKRTYDHNAEREKFLKTTVGAASQPHLVTKIATQQSPAAPAGVSMSFLSTIGKDFKAVFSWLGSAKGQAGVAGTENLAGVGAPVQAGITLLNNWMAEIVKAQALGEAAAATATGEGNTTKAAAVLNAMVPQVAAFAQTQGMSATSAANLNLINTSLVTALNALGAATSTTAATPAA